VSVVGLQESTFGGSLVSGGWFCGSAFDSNMVSVAMKTFYRRIYKKRNTDMRQNLKIFNLGEKINEY
jgi:hypothetical protein